MDGRTLRVMALDMPGTAIKMRFERPSFSVKKRTYMHIREDDGYATLKLTPDQQVRMIEERPDECSPARNSRGKYGWTEVDLEITGERLFRYLVEMAWRNVAPKWLIATREPPPTP